MKNPDFSKVSAVTAGKTKTTGVSPFSELELSKVYPNPNQPRKTFEDIEQLASTIKEHGLLQPITVVKKDDGYMIISGERRYKAHLHNESKTIKAYILDTTDENIQELSLIENIQRNDLTDFETAKHIVTLWETGRYEKKSDLAKKLGKSDTYISKAFSSLKLDSEILEDIEANKKDISVSVMDEIARVKDPTVQKEVYQKYSAGEITRDEIKEFKTKKEKKYDDGVFEVVEENFPRENKKDSSIKAIDEVRFQTITDIDQIISDLTKYIVIYDASIEDNWITNESGCIGKIHLDNDYEIAIFKLLEENIKLKREIEELKK